MPWLNSCLCSPDERPRPYVTPPLHLLLKGSDSPDSGQCHAFRSKVFKKPRPCHMCHQPILNEGSTCRVCKYVCHKTCEGKISPPAVRRAGEEPSYASPSSLGRTLNAIDNAGDYSRPNTPHKQTLDDWPETPRNRRRDSGMDLSYITERILALWFPGEVTAAEFRAGHQQTAHMLQSKHGSGYMVFNLSEPKGGMRREHSRVKECGWPPALAPPLERLCSVCKDMDTWLGGGSSRVAVLHVRGERERIGVVVAAYMHYSSICGSPEQALDRFAMKRYLDHKIGDLDLPSNKRYVEYFSGLLSGSIRINSSPLYLSHVTVLGAPNFISSGGCRAFIKVYEGLVPVYTSGVHSVGPDTREFTVNLGRPGLQLRGDILLKCYHRNYTVDEELSPGSSIGSSSTATSQRELVFACQFHTCAVTYHTLTFTRTELDSACSDPRFPTDGAVQLHFAGLERRGPPPAPTPAVPVDTSADHVTSWDSYEHLDLTPQLSPDSDEERADDGGGVRHTYGPVDGSLYAVVRSEPACPGSMDSGISSSTVRLEQHRELDKLLSDMLLTVRDIPDPDIPYHARLDSRPFTYGGLASPSLVRKASPQQQASPDFHEGTVVSGVSISQDNANQLSWLERQQAKLRERRTERTALLAAEVARRETGYSSDQAGDYSVPLHINTSKGAGSAPVSPHLPQRTSSVRLARARSADRARREALRDEGYTASEASPSTSPRPQTPAFPVHPRTPYSNGGTPNGGFDLASLPPKSPTAIRKEWGEGTLSRELSMNSSRGYDSSSEQYSPKSPVTNGSLGQYGGSPYYGSGRRGSLRSESPQEVSPAHVKFVRGTSKFWYKPNISREEAIGMLRDKAPGTFVVRDSNSFPGAFGLALKVASPPAPTRSPPTPEDLVRHFLIEPTSRGVRFRGCPNEPVFSSLSALVYQHTVTSLALPCLLVLPESDPAAPRVTTTAQILQTQGAACSVLYLLTVETESLTGPRAVSRSVGRLFSSSPLPKAVEVNFKVSSQGITLTDHGRVLFFRRHYPMATITYCGLDPEDRRWRHSDDKPTLHCFGFVARKPGSKADNECHIFCELEAEQPATAIVNFVAKLMLSSQNKSNIV
ncbi:tensin-2 isoform X3 [Halyomorpha halys]|uniref:tensin-2 isoform X3 n=1 Tax=Halyomorpha halys TaxID=286706 RepID=UPI0006D50648